MNKKGGALFIVMLILGVVLLLGLIITGMILFNKQITKEKEQIQNLNTTSLFLIPKDLDLKIPIESKYLIYYNNSVNNIVVGKGQLSPGYNEIVVPKGVNLTILCWDDNYYLTKLERNEYQSESISKFTLTCNMQKKGILEINHLGSIKSTYDIVNLNVSVKDYYQKLAICTGWSAGIIDVSLSDDFVNCDTFWINVSGNTYSCEELTEQCEYVDGSRCKKLDNEEIIPKYESKADRCFYTGINFKNQSKIFNFEVKSLDLKNNLDQINFYVLGMERVFDENSLELKWVYNDGIEYIIPYEE